jgi:hypothetical protein
MGLGHDLLDLMAGDELPRTVCIVVDQTLGDPLGDLEGDLGPGRSIEVDEPLPILDPFQGREPRSQVANFCIGRIHIEKNAVCDVMRCDAQGRARQGGTGQGGTGQGGTGQGGLGKGRQGRLRKGSEVRN